MPELPEVETIRSQLSEKLPLKINKVTNSAGLARNILKTDLPQIKNLKILKINRKGKILDFVFSDGTHLLSHLGMTGTWLLGEAKHKGNHLHLQLEVQQGKKKYFLGYDDPRRFGKMYFLDQALSEKKMNQVGFDLADPDLSLEYVEKSLLKYPQRAVKVTLLDQKLFAGSGNYIANEICARAKIRPDRLCQSLSQQDMKSIYRALRIVIQKALISGGTTFQGGYRDSTGQKGQGKNELVVFYQKVCQMCKKTPVQKFFLAQRGTYFCPHCQK